VGLGNNTEGGLTYSGRAARLDGRWAWEAGPLALSLGGGARALLSRRLASHQTPIAGLDLDGTTGWGLDVPIVFGWRSTADIVWLWTGVHAGYDRLRGEVGYDVGNTNPNPTAPRLGEITGGQTHVMGLLGIAVGFRHVRTAVEVHAGYQGSRGTLWGTDVKVDGFSVSPTIALLLTL